MTDTDPNSTITNSLKSSAINVFIKEKGMSRRGALPGDSSLLKPGDTSELVDFAGRDDISLIIISELVPGVGSEKVEGLHVRFGDELNLKSSELRRHVKGTFEFIYYFNRIVSLKSVESHIDVDVQHPDSEES